MGPTFSAASTVDEFILELDQFGQNLQDLSPVLQELGNQIVEGVRSRAPYKTGALRSSIRAYVTNNQLEIEMLYYGAFQNYGVMGTMGVKNGTVNPVQWGISPTPSGVTPFYAFKTRKWGIPA